MGTGKKKKEKNGSERSVRFPISMKLITIISVLVITVLGIVTFLISWFIRADVRLTAEENNHSINSRSAFEAEYELDTVRSNAFLLLDLLDAVGSSGTLARQASAFFFERNQDIAAIVLPDEQELINNRFFLSNELDISLISRFLEMEKETIVRTIAGETVVLNAAPFFELPIIALFYPWKEHGFAQAVVMFFSTENLTENFATASINSSFMVNHEGDLLVHSDFELIRAGANFVHSPILREMRKNNDENRQLLYRDEDGKEYFGAYRKLSIGDIGVITIVESSRIFEAVNATTRRNLYLMGSVLFLSILFIWFFSKSISTPVKELAVAASEIEQGNFILDLRSKTHDELGILMESFVHMGKGLAERERLKDTFGRFINKEIAEKAMKGELTLGGETKQVTIFFSDIRSFTAISEKLEPHEVVEFLNEYMTRMVHCVNLTGGVVDKYIGDAIMAVWGAPVSSGSPQEDALNCVRAALMMRHALLEFNQGRGGDRKPIIKIGCGINTGPVVAGQIGSSERMEYTVIGDAVNFASRTEALNKPLGSDILITENTYELVKEQVWAQEMPSVTVKGKEKPVRMFAVINMPLVTDIPGAGKEGPKSMKEVRELLNIPTPDMSKVNVDAEEKKYKIQG